MARDNGTSQPLLGSDDPLGEPEYGRSNGAGFKSAFDSPSPRDRLTALWAAHRRRFLLGGALFAAVVLVAKLASPGRPSGSVGSYDRSLAIVGASDLKGNGSLWAVITTINYPTDTVKTLAAMPDLNLVVVGDTKSPKDWSLPGVHFLDVERQKRLGLRLHDALPYRHYARKNIGYLFAAMNGARTVYETDDDNELLGGFETFDLALEPTEMWELVDSRTADGKVEEFSRNVCNPYPNFGQPSVWPRGFPLQNVADAPCSRYRRRPVNNAIQQGLANGDPDVDALFRLTRKDRSEDIRIKFADDAPPIAFPYGMISPFNSQNTLFHYGALPLLYIPMTTSFRVCDIWRGYWAQRLVWEIGGQLAFSRASVFQARNVHDYLDDYLDEDALYTQSHHLVDFLLAWRSRSSTFFGRISDLAHAMADKKFWQQGDADGIDKWLDDLAAIGFVEPPLVDWESELSTREPLGVPGWERTEDDRPSALFNYLAPQQQSIYLSDTLRPAALRTLPASTLDGCPYALAEVKISAIWSARDLLGDFLDSYMLNMPCFPKLHIAVPDREVELFERFGTERKVPNAQIRAEKLPAGDWSWNRAALQWTDWIVDEYITAPYVMFFDVDTLMTVPLSCSMSFDEAGKPITRYWPWWRQWSRNHEALRLAAEKRPEKWRWTEADVAALEDHNYMSYFPVIVPTFILPLVREMFEDAYGKPFEELVRTLDDYSQFDMMRRLTRLLHPDMVRWIPVEKSDIAFARDASRAAQEWKYGLDPILHVPFHHSYDLATVTAPVIRDGDDAYVARARIVAHHALCMREKHWPSYNAIDPTTLFRRLLPNDADRRCDDAALVAPPETIFTHDSNFTRFDTKLAQTKVEALRAGLADPRPLCFEPLPARGSLGQSWWTPNSRSAA